jgi:small subunit ribosomal protein S17
MTKNTEKKERKLQGVVVSDKMDKTRVVEVSSLKKHAKYQRYFKVSKKFSAHDSENQYKEGDAVIIRETRPMSRTKRWEIVGKIENKK